MTSKLENKHGGRRYQIRVFTEQGVAMFETILKSLAVNKVDGKEWLESLIKYINIS